MRYNGFYLVGNYPDPGTFFEAAIAGLQYFDFIEVGLPFSDPVADGPALAYASHRALSAGVTTDTVLQSCKALKEHIVKIGSSKKIYIMTYANKVFHCGIEDSMQQFVASGIDGIILADVPFVESAPFADCAKSYNLEYIHFITPESTHTQIQTICSAATGFIYTISLRGTTGSSLTITDELKGIITLSKKYATVPVVMGFGIQNRQDIQQALQYADGFIMGTALVKKLEHGVDAYKYFLNTLFEYIAF